MLSLSRKKGERFVIRLPQGDVWVEVLKVNCDRVRLGLTAPPEITIHRQERFAALRTGGPGPGGPPNEKGPSSP